LQYYHTSMYRCRLLYGHTNKIASACLCSCWC